MTQLIRHALFAIILTEFLFANNAVSAPLYINDFEDENGGAPLVTTPEPVYQLPPAFMNVYGPGNMFEVSDSSCYTGKYSLRLTYNGRNNFCNTCGATNVEHKQGLDGVDYFVADTDEDLTALDYPATTKNYPDGPSAAPGRIIYNKDAGYAKYEITAIENRSATHDKLVVNLLNPGINGEAPVFNGGDEVAITRECGVDGFIGRRIDRRSDCNALITWFGKSTVQGSQAPGQSIFRRVYLKAEIASSPIHQKLRYWTLPDGEHIILLADSALGPLEPQLAGLNTFGGDPFYKQANGNLSPAGTQFKRGIWYYVEEEFKAATVSGQDPVTGEDIYNNDGEYRLWFSEAASASIGKPPAINATGLNLPVVEWASLWGNVQHDNLAAGQWYMDDLAIQTDTRIGPIPQTCANTVAPKAPDAN